MDDSSDFASHESALSDAIEECSNANVTAVLRLLLEHVERAEGADVALRIGGQPYSVVFRCGWGLLDVDGQSLWTVSADDEIEHVGALQLGGLLWGAGLDAFTRANAQRDEPARSCHIRVRLLDDAGSPIDKARVAKRHPPAGEASTTEEEDEDHKRGAEREGRSSLLRAIDRLEGELAGLHRQVAKLRDDSTRVGHRTFKLIEGLLEQAGQLQDDRVRLLGTMKDFAWGEAEQRMAEMRAQARWEAFENLAKFGVSRFAAYVAARIPDDQMDAVLSDLSAAAGDARPLCDAVGAALDAMRPEDWTKVRELVGEELASDLGSLAELAGSGREEELASVITALRPALTAKVAQLAQAVPGSTARLWARVLTVHAGMV